jgi:hypothetical protein
MDQPNKSNSFLFQRLFFISAGIIILLQTASGQANDFLKLKYDSTVTLKVQSIDNVLYSSFSDSILAYTSSEDIDTASRTIKFYSYNIFTGDTFSAMTKVYLIGSFGYLNQLMLTKKFLTLLFDDRILVYKRVKSKFEFQKIIIRPDQFNCIALLQNEKLLFSSIYNYHPESCKNKTNFLIYDPVNDVVTDVFHPDLNSLAFSHFKSSWVATNGDKIAIANPGKYNIKFYNIKFKALDSISYTDTSWKGLENYELPFNTKPEEVNPKTIIDSILNFQKYISRVEQIYFPNADHIWVISKTPFQEDVKRRIDFWTRTKKRWTLDKTIDNYSCVEADSDTINFSNSKLDFYDDLPVYFSNNTIIKVSEDDFPLKEGVQFSEFKNMKNNFYKKNEPHYAIKIFTIKK